MPPLQDSQIGPAIQNAGYQYVNGTGYGPSALWVAGEWTGPDKSQFVASVDPKTNKPYAAQTQEQIANELFPSSSPYLAANNKPDAAEKAPDRITSGGVVYERGADGNWTPAKGIPSSAEGAGGITQYQGAQLGLDQQRIAAQQQQWQATFDQNMKLAQQQYEQHQADLAQQKAINDQNMAFAQNKEAFAQSQDNQRLALQARAQVQSEQQAAADLNLKQATLQMQWETFNATAQNEAAKFNASMAFQVQQANQQFESQKQDRLAAIATQAGTLAQDTGDRGKLAATALANSGWGGANVAASGQDYRTDESKTPLESLLRTRQDVQQSSSPYSYTPILAGTIGQPQMGAGTDTTANPNAPWQTAPGTSYKPALAGGALPALPVGTPQTVGGAGVTDPRSGAPISQQTHAADNLETIRAAQSLGIDTSQQIKPMANGGTVQGAYIGDERGPELHIPDPHTPGQTIILNDKQAKSVLGVSIKELMDRGQQSFASGGIFNDSFGNIPSGDSNRDLSTGFLSDAYKRAAAGTPFEGAKQLPSPVFLSSPGTNPFVSQLLGSLKAIGEGVPAAYTQWAAQQYAPSGIRDTLTHPAGVVGRSI